MIAFKQFAFALLLTAPLNADDADNFYKEGIAYSQASNWKAAHEAFTLGEQENPQDPRFPLELAGVAYKAGNHGQAKRHLRRALYLAPDDGYAAEVLASLYLLDGNLSAAVPVWNRIGQPLIRRTLTTGGRAAIAERAMEVNPGDVLKPADLDRTTANFNRLGIESHPTLIPLSDGRWDFKEAVAPAITIRSWPTILLGAAAMLPYQAVHVGFDLPWKTLLHFDSLVRWDPNKRLLAGSISGMIDNNPHFVYRAEGEERNEIWSLAWAGSQGFSAPSFKMQRTAGRIQFTNALGSRMDWTNGFSAAQLNFTNSPTIPTFASGTEIAADSGLQWRAWENDSRQVALRLNGKAEYGRLLSLPNPFARLQGGIWLGSKEQPRMPQLTFQARGGWSAGDVPFDRLFMLGMERDNDLWLRGHVGTNEGRKGNSPLGTKFALLQFDASKTLYKREFVAWRLGPFFDFGNAGGPLGSRGRLYDIGLETRVRLMDAVEFVGVGGYDIRSGGIVFYSAVQYRLNSW
jgi:hypothetical protein